MNKFIFSIKKTTYYQNKLMQENFYQRQGQRKPGIAITFKIHHNESISAIAFGNTGLNQHIPMEHQVEPEGAPLLPVQRRNRIAEFLRLHGAVTLQQLGEALHVSVSTLRRDLDALAEDGIVERTHGGAVLKHQHYSTFEPHIAAARNLSPREKRLIGKTAAAGLIPGQSVIFDSGSTVLEAAHAAAARNIELIAVTNDLEIAQALGTSPLIQVYVCGGQLRPGSNTLVGEQLKNIAGIIHADVLFLGAHAVSDDVISETSPEVAAAKRALMKAANSCRLLIDSSKFRPRVFMTVCPITEVAELITDTGAPIDEIKRLRSAGIHITLVDTEE